jgi:NAD(P)H-dependent FMN reductase
MNVLVQTFLRGVLDRVNQADLGRLPASYQMAGGGLMRRIAAVGALRLALRWPSLAVIVVLSVVAARVMTARCHRSDELPRALPAP